MLKFRSLVQLKKAKNGEFKRIVQRASKPFKYNSGKEIVHDDD